MIAKILSSSATFNGVKYNTDKIDNGKGILLKAANFGILEGLSNWRPQDFKNYFKAMSSRNSFVRKPQFHAVLSAKGRSMDKEELSGFAEKWMTAMGYGKQPHLVVLHNDTANNHVHIVSTRINWDGRKVNDSYEKLRAVKAMREIMQQDTRFKIKAALDYRFSTTGQLRSILESKGYSDLYSAIDPDTIKFHPPSESRAKQLAAIIRKYSPKYSIVELAAFLKQKMGIELIFHAKDGKPAYGYTVIDHAQKNAFKGSDILPLKELLNANEKQEKAITIPVKNSNVYGSTAIEPTTSLPINIARDVDDEATHGRRRRKRTRGTGR